MNNLAKSVQNALAQKGLECTVIELSDSVRTAHDAAYAIGYEDADFVREMRLQ